MLSALQIRGCTVAGIGCGNRSSLLVMLACTLLHAFIPVRGYVRQELHACGDICAARIFPLRLRGGREKRDDMRDTDSSPGIKNRGKQECKTREDTRSNSRTTSTQKKKYLDDVAGGKQRGQQGHDERGNNEISIQLERKKRGREHAPTDLIKKQPKHVTLANQEEEVITQDNVSKTIRSGVSKKNGSKQTRIARDAAEATTNANAKGKPKMIAGINGESKGMQEVRQGREGGGVGGRVKMRRRGGARGKAQRYEETYLAA